MSSNAVQSTSGSLFIEGYPDEKSVKAVLRKLNLFAPIIRREGDYLEVLITANRLFTREQLTEVVSEVSELQGTVKCLYARSDRLEANQFVIFCPKVSRELSGLFYELWLSRKIRDIKKHSENPVVAFIKHREKETQ